MNQLKSPAEYGYVNHNNICLFQKGPLSQWWGGFKDQTGGFVADWTIFSSITAGGLPAEFWNKDLEFNCCEQWMMFSKAAVFQDWNTAQKILAEPNPNNQKNLGREVKNYSQGIWDGIKYDVVLAGNRLKFAQNASLADFLRQWHPFTIFAEGASYDAVWGIGIDINDPDALDINKWKGENLLGRAIMDVRRDL